MYVCVCNEITERQVKQAIGEGAMTVSQIRQKLAIDQQCGSCNDCLEDCLDEVFARAPAASPAGAAAG